MSIDKKRIVRNTIFLFFRFTLILGVTFYVSRVLLDKLGVEDYGLYNVVYGVIGMLSFINGTLASSTSRFITYELGKENNERLTITFTTALYAHIILVAIILIIAMSFGIWYVCNVLVVPESRFNAAFIVYLISIFSTVLSILQVPFTAEIIAHERMDAYAYIGVFDAITRFAAAYALSYCSTDKLVFYACFLLLSNIFVFLLYVIYSKIHFPEIHFSIKIDRLILKDILKFSGWNILAKFSNTIIIQGIILLYNLFFAPAVVVAQAIGNQITHGISLLINNVRSAINPQVVKLYAKGNEKESEKLTIISAEYIFYLLMMICLPCILIMPTLLNLWLKETPEYTVLFARLLVFQFLLENFNNAFYQPLVAVNKISVNSILEGITCLLQFIILYCLFFFGYSPVWARYLGIWVVLFLSFVEKPLLLWKYLNFDLKKIFQSLFRCVIALFIALLLNFCIYVHYKQENLTDSLLVVCLSTLSVIVSCGIVLLCKANWKIKFKIYK